MTMNTIISKVSEYISQLQLLTDREQPVIVGLSGGADSTALTLILHDLGYKVICAHCNFHLRGEESDRDAIHAREIANILGLEFLSIDWDVDSYCLKNKVSVEEACRQLRYDWFSKLLIEKQAQKIAVGHNLNDNTETFLFNLQRGTGIAGLIGIPAANNRNVIRPLLCLRRNEIEQFLHQRDASFVTDSTNLQSIYSRNKIRNILLPTFRSQFPNVDNGILKTISHLAEVDEAYRQFLTEKKAKYSDSAGNILLHTLVSREPLAELMLYEWLKDDGFTRSQSKDITSSYQSSGAKFTSSKSRYIIDRGILTKLSDVATPLDLDAHFSIDLFPRQSFEPVNSPDVTYYDRSLLDGDPLYVKFWEKGDRLRPFGMSGSKKLSDIFNDAKISAAKKTSVPLLCKGDKIIWIAGLRRSIYYPVTETTTEIVSVRYLK